MQSIYIKYLTSNEIIASEVSAIFTWLYDKKTEA